MSDIQPLSLYDLSEKAKSYGCELVVGTPTTLLLDLDTKVQFDSFENIWKLFEKHGYKRQASWTSRNGKGLHVLIISPHEMSELEAIGLETVLGSDPTRSALSTLEHHMFDGKAIRCLFRPHQTEFPT